MNEQEQEIARTNVYKPCVICGEPGVEKHSEVLPDRGVLIKVIHDDRKICEFVEYASISSFVVGYTSWFGFSATKSTYLPFSYSIP